MCKVFVINDMSHVNQKGLATVVNTIAKHITKSERHGFGYAIQGDKGLFGERTTTPANFKFSMNREWLNYNFIQKTYNRFGKISPLKGAGIFHGRTSTNDVNIENTHPMVKNDWTLIHNGVVRNIGPTYKKLTTNDTEDLLHYMSTKGIKAVEENLSGYYAFAAFDKKGNLHIARDDQATLYCVYSPTIKSLVFGTTEDLVTTICDELKWKMSNVAKVIDNVYLTFKNGKQDPVSQQTIEPYGYGSYESKYMSQSLSYLDSKTYGDYDDESWNRAVRTYRRNKDRDTQGFTETALAPETKELDFTPEYYGISDENYDLYCKELTSMDSSYKVRSYNGQELSVEEFLEMPMDDKIMLEVIRPDGTLMCPFDYKTDKLAA